MQIDIIYPSLSVPPPPSGVFRVLKKWEQLTGLDAVRYNANGIDQFGYYSPYITDAAGKWVNDWAVNNNWSYLTHDDMLKIFQMQVTDDFTPAQKMSYLCAWGDSWGNPMRVPGDHAWNIAPLVKMIGAFYAGQTVQVLEQKEILIDYMGEKKYILMSRVRPFSRSDFGASDVHKVHIMTGVSATNQFRLRVKGIVKLPVALGPDFTFAGGFKPAQWWLMDRWLL